MPRPCTVDGCDKPVHSRNLCALHFGRWRRNGDPLGTGQHGGRRDGQVVVDEPDPRPAVVVREVLEARRAISPSGTFEWSWSVALDHALRVAGPERSEWFAVLHQHRGDWRRAYYRTPTERPFPVEALLPLMDDREPVPVHRRAGAPIVTTGQRHDGDSMLDPVSVPWCSSQPGPFWSSRPEHAL